MASFSRDSHWRDSARQARFFIVDARAAFPILLFILHIRWWTFFLAVAAIGFLAVLEYYGFTLPVFIRWLRSFFAGPHKTANPWWKR